MIFLLHFSSAVGKMVGAVNLLDLIVNMFISVYG
jgi:hypothetical protein